MKRLIHLLQTVTGATKGEVIIVSALLGGLLLGHAIRAVQQARASPLDARASAAEIAQLLDSLAGPMPPAVPTEPDGSGREVERMRDTPPLRRTPTGPTVVNLNTASKTRLMTLPGVGEATAERIMQHRQRSPFQRAEDIMLVKGIGERRYERMRPFITAP